LLILIDPGKRKGEGEEGEATATVDIKEEGKDRHEPELEAGTK
jgi:hypothetical protein